MALVVVLVMNRLIEDYLRTRGARCFRGHHDDEYFFLVGLLRRKGEPRGHLNVHLEVCGPERDGVRVSIAADRYHPAGGRAGIEELIARWNAEGGPVAAAVRESCDPRLVGLDVRGVCRPAGLVELTRFVDAAVAGAVALFGQASLVAGQPRQQPGVLRDAG